MPECNWCWHGRLPNIDCKFTTKSI